MWKLGVLVLLVSLSVKESYAACGNCNEQSGVACISRNEFRLCPGGKIDTTQKFKCPGENGICTRFSEGCIESGKPACDSEAGCGTCTNRENGEYICTGRTTFEMCMNQRSTGSKMSCLKNQLCNAKKGAMKETPCQIKCLTSIELCDRVLNENPTDPTETTTTYAPTPTQPITETDEPITAPTTDPVTDPNTPPTNTPITTDPSIPQNSAQAVCDNQDLAGRYPYSNDRTCNSSYVNCFWKSESLQGAHMNCPEGKYFNAASLICKENINPIWCDEEVK